MKEIFSDLVFLSVTLNVRYYLYKRGTNAPATVPLVTSPSCF